jgi:hypothetical protein
MSIAEQSEGEFKIHAHGFTQIKRIYLNKSVQIGIHPRHSCATNSCIQILFTAMSLAEQSSIISSPLRYRSTLVVWQINSSIVG